MTKHALLKAVRVTHLYYGVLISPALMFFAFTGFLQTFKLHEASRDGSYTPPAIIERLGHLHKEANIDEEKRGPGGPGQGQGRQQGQGGGQGQGQGQGQQQGQGQPQGGGQGQGQGGDRGPNQGGGQGQGGGQQRKPESSHWPEKIYFGIVAIGLFIAALTGLYMSWMYSRRKWVIVATFVAGIVIPVVFLAF